MIFWNSITKIVRKKEVVSNCTLLNFNEKLHVKKKCKNTFIFNYYNYALSVINRALKWTKRGYTIEGLKCLPIL